MKELINRVRASKATKSKWKGSHNSKEWQDASKLNLLLFGKPLNKRLNCECLNDLFLLMDHKISKLNTITMNNQNSQFRLSNEQSIIMLHGCMPLSKHSTDKQFLSMLKHHPGQIVKFASFPSDWRVQCGLDEETEEPTEDNAEGSTESENLNEISTEGESEETEESTEDNEIDLMRISDREAELRLLSNSALKAMLTKNQMPTKTDKSSLVAAILAVESK
jgi:hypothetical protein